MTSNKRKIQLHASYQAMIDSVEEFVVKEGKTLHQAFQAAEEKLGNSKEMSKKEIQQASKELKDNLRLWAEAAEGVSKAYKDQIKFDLAHAKSSVWEKLQSIANTNTAELIEFTTTLKERAQAAVTENHLAAHQEHNQWGSEHALWLDEIEFWKKGHEQALTKLVAIEKALKQQSTSLAEHAQAIKDHAEITHEHETVMKNAEQDATSKVFEAADENETATHQQERKLHMQNAELHLALKTHHFKIMAMINTLYKQTHKAE